MTVLEQISMCIWSWCRSPDRVSRSSPCPSPLCWCSRCIPAMSPHTTPSLPHLPMAWGLPLPFVSSSQVEQRDHVSQGAQGPGASRAPGHCLESPSPRRREEVRCTQRKLPKGTADSLSNRNLMVSGSNFSLSDVISQIQHGKPQPYRRYSYSAIASACVWAGEMRQIFYPMATCHWR